MLFASSLAKILAVAGFSKLVASSPVSATPIGKSAKSLRAFPPGVPPLELEELLELELDELELDELELDELELDELLELDEVPGLGSGPAPQALRAPVISTAEHV